ncbi:hypothetical protein DEU56DRAFT_854850 [Suillus clintonianus]|uniref:uncharacterized protein n=1 Tax=Suillus clintonianus TaxID=1904413 RepID=UPI001B861C07|nr:uncharacterized protein DEU56DRAFT_854850 [Suillus clintonianus]KAG2143052.1 hypothetical protein DEU56DRAFT_854850 [Suillus clintonianus]
MDNLVLCHPRVSSGQDPNQTIIVQCEVSQTIPSDHVLLKVDRFGFSANNVTYQALGEASHFRYFDFHHAPEAEGVSSKTHGVTPVWGFGTIIKSTHPKVHTGERVYGYFAPARYLVLPVSQDVNKYAFFVPRSHLPPDRRPYNQVTRCATDPLYDPSPTAEDLTMLYRPLFWTSFWCEDWLNSTDYKGGSTQILMSSASSKTAFCLAYLIRRRNSLQGSSRRVIGLTSMKNLAFTKRLGLYDDVFDYESFDTSLVGNLARGRWIYVDVAGNDGLNARVRDHFRVPGESELVTRIALGFTNVSPSTINPGLFASWDTGSEAPQGADPILEHFFMPEWLSVRKQQLSVSAITQMQKEAWTRLMSDCQTWGVSLRRVCGPSQVKAAYEEIVRRGLAPEDAFVWSLWGETAEIGSRAKL